MRKFKFAILIALLLAGMSLSAVGSYIYYMPVEVDSSLSPEVLMPGDAAFLTITIKNGGAEYGIGKDTSGLTLSTPVNRTILQGTEDITVLNGEHGNVGMIGPNDEVVLYYNIVANDSIADGTYFLDFCVEAGYDSEEICRQIPIKIDSGTLSLSRSELPETGKISLDVANPRQNTINAVTIIPEASGVEFSPEKYYIGTMKSDEIFTIEFDLSTLQPSSAETLNFRSIFKNGDNWHESQSYNMTYRAANNQAGKDGGSSSNAGLSTTTIAVLILFVGSIGGAYLWRRRKGKT
jgi:hypothetical protein